MPQFSNVMNQQFNPAAQGVANAAAGANPVYTASGLQQMGQYMPGYQQAGIDASTRQAGATADLIGGQGGRAAINADMLSAAINPEYYQGRSQVANASADLMKSLGPLGGLGGGEMAAAERAINQGNVAGGNLGNINPMNTVANAMNFGEFARQKQGIVSNAIGQVNSTLPNMINPNFNPVALATGAGNTAGNFGLAQFNPQQGGPASLTGPAMTTALGQNIFGYSGAPSGNQRSIGGGVGGGGSSGGTCGFIITEAYYGQIPWSVRRCRDRYYCTFPDIAKGYQKMCKWLVPAMKKWPLVRFLVWKAMVVPLSQHGEFVTRRANTPHKFIRKLWFTFWNLTGK
jgi:hypothetical protein